MPIIDPERKKEYNRRQREKEKLRKEKEKSYVEELPDSPTIEIEKVPVKRLEEVQTESKEEIHIMEEQPEEVQEEEKEEYILDKETYNFLMAEVQKARAQQQQPEPIKQQIEEKPKEEQPRVQQSGPSFFQMCRTQMMSTAAGIVPILLIQGAVHGAKFLTSSTTKPTLESMPTNTTNQPKKARELPTYGHVLPSVNSF